MTMANERKRGGRAALFVVAVLVAAMFAGSTLLTPLYDIYKRAFGFSQLTLTLIYAVYALGNVLALLFMGRLSDQIGRRRTALPAIAGAALSSAFYLAAPRVGEAWLFVGRVVSGFAIGVASAAATAWIAELTRGDRTRASVIAVVANYLGIALGPLLAGSLAHYTPAPLTLTHWVYLGVLLLTALTVATVPETVSRPARSLREVSLRPRIGVPREIRARFVSPAATVFASFALVGFYAALAPTVLARDLHRPDPLVSGATVASMFVAGAAGA
jgi:MFS family permease